MEKLGNIHDEVSNFYKERKSVRKNQMEMLEMETTIAQINASGLINRL